MSEGQFAERSVSQIRQRANYLADKNSETLTRLAKQGVRISPENLSLQRLEVLINHVLGDEHSMERVLFEERWHEHLATGLKNTEAEAEKRKAEKNKKKIHVPGHKP